MLPEQSWQPTTDPAVFETIAKGARYLASGLRVRTIDDLCLPVEIKYREPASSTDHAQVARLLPQAVHRARCRSTSLDASRPQRITATAGQRRVMLAPPTVHPQPRRHPKQIAKRGPGANERYSTPAKRAESSPDLLWSIGKAAHGGPAMLLAQTR